MTHLAQEELKELTAKAEIGLMKKIIRLLAGKANAAERYRMFQFIEGHFQSKEAAARQKEKDDAKQRTA